jgi:hypothetical protein
MRAILVQTAMFGLDNFSQSVPMHFSASSHHFRSAFPWSQLAAAARNGQGVTMLHAAMCRLVAALSLCRSCCDVLLPRIACCSTVNNIHRSLPIRARDLKPASSGHGHLTHGAHGC